MVSPEELAALDDFRFKQRMPSRSAAARELFRLGLASVGMTSAEAGRSSASFGVLAKSSKKKDDSDSGADPAEL